MNDVDLSHRYLWGPGVDQLLVDEAVASLTTASSNTNRWALTDHLGTIRDWVNDSGTLLDHAEYDSAGRRLDTAAIDAAFGFQGLLHDEWTGNNYNRARWSDPNTGTFLSEDPIKDGYNWRVAYGNAANMFVDPTGLYGPAGHFWTTYAIAMATGNFTPRQAYQLAYYSQYPDQDPQYEAVDTIKQMGGHLAACFGEMPSQDDYRDSQAHSKRVFDLIHSMHGGDPTAVAQRRLALRQMIMDPNLTPWQRGTLIHALADAYAHVDSRTGNAYGWPIGHARDGHSPDYIGNAKRHYEAYVIALYFALGGRGDALQNPDIWQIITVAMTVPWVGDCDEADRQFEYDKFENLARNRFRYSFSYRPLEKGFNRDPTGLTPDIPRNRMDAFLNQMEQTLRGR
jgi:RHS repeat-associated protein